MKKAVDKPRQEVYMTKTAAIFLRITSLLSEFITELL
jgi:hypothetical protein